MRIIGGSARGRTLMAPRGLRTRPTQDAIRESLFNILCREVQGARVLDLFAGSGALALESLSRGARSAVLVDHAPAAVRAIRRNIAHTGFADHCESLCCDWKTALTRLCARGRAFDLVFLDPPYGQVDLNQVCGELVTRGLLAGDMLVVAEHHSGAALRIAPPLREADARCYGDTTVTIYRKGEGTQGADRDLSGQL